MMTTEQVLTAWTTTTLFLDEIAADFREGTDLTLDAACDAVLEIVASAGLSTPDAWEPTPAQVTEADAWSVPPVVTRCLTDEPF